MMNSDNSGEDVRKQMCQIIVFYERDVMNFWAYVKESNLPDDLKDELMKKFRIYNLGV